MDSYMHVKHGQLFACETWTVNMHINTQLMAAERFMRKCMEYHAQRMQTLKKHDAWKTQWQAGKHGERARQSDKNLDGLA